MPIYNVTLDVTQGGAAYTETDTIMLAAAAPTREKAAEQIQVAIEGLTFVHDTRVVGVDPPTDPTEPPTLDDLNNLD